MNFRPLTTSLDANEKVWRSSEFWTESNFKKETLKHVAAIEHIAECAKIYIIKHYEKIQDWKSLNVKIYDNSGNPTEYYNYVPRKDRPKPKKKLQNK
jgi:hypothetical protein